MNRRILIQAATPTMVLGLCIWVACLSAAWYVNKLQRNVAHIFTDNVTSLEAGSQLEINLRRLRFHQFLYLLDPGPKLRQTIHDDEALVEQWLARAEEIAFTQPERDQMGVLRKCYFDYRQDVDRACSMPPPAQAPKFGFRELAKTLSVRHILEPCHDYRLLNQAMMDQAADKAQAGSRKLSWLLVFLGVFSPLGGLISGFGIAKRFSFSLNGLSIRVQDLARHLNGDPGSPKTATFDSFQQLDHELEAFVQHAVRVSERLERQEREILRARQLAAVGQLAASVAHEVRNPLTAIKMLVEAGLQTAKSKPMTAEKLQLVHGEILRLEQRVQAFLDFARPPALQSRLCDIADLVTQAAELMQPRAQQQGVHIHVGRGHGVLTSIVDRGQLCSVFVNLFLNAFDAMPRGGALTIELSRPNDHFLVLTVVDTGPGIDVELIDRLFEPFATSKPTGSGLGLSISKRVVEDHGGRITATNLDGGGACFTLMLPHVEPECEHAVPLDCG